MSLTCPSGHNLELSSNANAWVCDGANEPEGCPCGTRTTQSVAGQSRFRCNLCDFDYCGRCYELRLLRGQHRVPSCPLPPIARTFRDKVDLALKEVQKILDVNKHPVYAADAPHKFDDKYLLVEVLTRAALSSSLTTLSFLGVDEAALKQLKEWSHSRSVSLRFRAEEKCTFVREVKREVDSSTSRVVTSDMFGKFTSKTVTTITEYLWSLELRYTLEAYRGVGGSCDDVVVLHDQLVKQTLVTSVQANPRWANMVHPSIDANISALLCSLDASCAPVLYIDRRAESCRTPSRNQEVKDALSHFSQFRQWCQSVCGFFSSELYPLVADKGIDIRAISSSGIFVPVLPVFNDGAAVVAEVPPRALTDGSMLTLEAPIPTVSTLASSASAAADLHLDVAEVGAFLATERRNIENKHREMERVFATPDVVLTAAEAKLIVTLLHAVDVCEFYQGSIDAVEEMLRDQLVAAIGKVVGPADFVNFMKFNNKKLFAESYHPKPFCYAVRRSESSAPEGVISITESMNDGSLPECIDTIVKHGRISAQRPFRISLNAATTLRLGGDINVHAYLRHRFGAASGAVVAQPSAEFTARARQFSSYIVLLGRISSADTFDPKFGMIVENKDEISIPLELEAIPSAKEFRDAIESLSPEQQEFAKAFRGMQLESTLFGVCVIQIKPQMEKLLRLSPDSLTKEIQLTQDLMELFIKYQIPSDLLSFDGDEGASSADRIAAVKGFVSSMKTMIGSSKQREIDEKKQEDLYSLHSSALDYSLEQNELLDVAESEVKETSYLKDRKVSRRLSRMTRRLDEAPPAAATARSSSSSKSAVASKSESTFSATSESAQATANVPQGDEMRASSDIDQSSHDITKMPRLLDQKFEELDKEGAVRPTIINPGKEWTKKAQKALLAEPTTATWRTDEQKSEKSRAFDLLDALSRSGGLTVDHASLHVVIAATHCFDRSIIDTLVMDNVNPIAKVERSTLIMAATVHERPAAELVRRGELDRIRRCNPEIL